MQESSTRIFIYLLVAAGFMMKLCWIGANDLAHDEPFTVLQAHRSIAGLFGMLPEENNPPLHFLLMHFWVKLVPLDAGWLRVPSALFSALTLWPLFLIGRALAGQRTAVIASLLFLFSGYHFGFAHEVRAYSLFALMATTSMWQLHRVVAGHGTVILTLVNILMVYTHFFGWLMIGVQLLSVLLVKEWRPILPKYFRVLAFTCLSYLPYAFIFFGRFSTSVQKGTWLTPPQPEEIYNMIWRWSNAPVVAVFFMVIISIHLTRSRAAFLSTRIAMIWTFVPLIGMFLVSYFVPMFLDRYLIYASPGFYLLCALSANSLIANGKYRNVPAAIAVALMAFTFKPWKSNWPRPSLVVEGTIEMRKNDAVPLYIHPWWYAHTYAWHLDRDLFLEPGSLFSELAAQKIFPLERIEELPEVLRNEERILLIVAGAEEGRQVAAFAEENGTNMVEHSEPDRHVRIHQVYSTGPAVHPGGEPFVDQTQRPEEL